MNEIIHLVLFAVWFVGFVLLMWGVCIPNSYDFDTYVEYAKEAKPYKIMRYVGGAMVIGSLLVYWILQ